MGCKYCSLGEACHGPLGADDLEVNCDCDCHKCPDCGSAYCEKMGGPDKCQSDMSATDIEAMSPADDWENPDNYHNYP